MLDNKYDPRLKSTDELVNTFICGEKILEELMNSLQSGKNEKLSNQSWIITGPRGAGKSHLLVLLYGNIKKHKTLSRHWLPLIFPEELFDVESMHRFLLKVFENMFNRENGGGALKEISNEFERLKKVRIKGSLKEKKEQKHRLTKKLFELLVEVNKTTGKKIILMLENLQHLFREQLSEDDLQHLRSFMHEHPGVFIIIGTALTVFDQIENYGSPFYHFFRLRSLDQLDHKGVMDFLARISSFRQDKDMESRIENNRHYIHTYTLLTGGNPRLILFLYELLLDNEHLDTNKILGKIMELTPYFLGRTRDESSQRKLILDALATGPPAQTATEIGNYINAEQKSVTEQLKRLDAEGWVREIEVTGEGVKSKEVFYILRDYFYRVWYKVRKKGIDESDIYCMAELAAILFDRTELEDRLKTRSEPLVEERRFLYQKALELAKDAGFMNNLQILLYESKNAEVREFMDKIAEMTKVMNEKNWENAIALTKKFMVDPKFKLIGYYSMAFAYYSKGDFKESYKCYSEAIKYGRELTSFNILYLKEIAVSIFSGDEELRRLLNKRSSLETKMESLCRLVLLGKLIAVTEVFDLFLKEKELPVNEAEKLEFFLNGYLTDILQNQNNKEELRIVMKYWMLLSYKIYGISVFKKFFLTIIMNYIMSVDRENISLNVIEELLEQLYEEGIEISGIILNIIRAVKNPGAREAQQWMSDPLFELIVNRLSNRKPKL